MAKKIIEPQAGHVITVGKNGVPRLLVQGRNKGELDAYSFDGQIQFIDLRNSGALYDGIYVFAARSLEEYFKKTLRNKK